MGDEFRLVSAGAAPYWMIGTLDRTRCSRSETPTSGTSSALVFCGGWRAAWSIMEAVIERVLAAETYELRHLVLRRGDSPAGVAADDDDHPENGHFAHKIDDRVVATGTIRRRPTPTGVEPAWQIRGMAVEPEHRGKGLGSAILSALLDHADAHGGGVIWCEARIAAKALYERQGFTVAGDPFDDPVAGVQVPMLRDRI